MPGLSQTPKAEAYLQLRINCCGPFSKVEGAGHWALVVTTSVQNFAKRVSEEGWGRGGSGTLVLVGTCEPTCERPVPVSTNSTNFLS